MIIPDIQSLSAEDLIAAWKELAEEEDRRRVLLTAKPAVEDFVRQYAAAGGDPADLVSMAQVTASQLIAQSTPDGAGE